MVGLAADAGSRSCTSCTRRMCISTASASICRCSTRCRSPATEGPLAVRSFSPARIRDQSSDVAGAHLAARRSPPTRPTAGSVILAGVDAQDGHLRFFCVFAIPLFPTVAVEAIPLFMALAVIGIIYGALVAMMQPDLKRLIAYSSVSHLGFVMLGIFALNPQGIDGAIYQMLNHGISTGGLFFAGRDALHEASHARDFRVSAACGRACRFTAANLYGCDGCRRSVSQASTASSVSF